MEDGGAAETLDEAGADEVGTDETDDTTPHAVSNKHIIPKRVSFFKSHTLLFKFNADAEPLTRLCIHCLLPQQAILRQISKVKTKIDKVRV